MLSNSEIEKIFSFTIKLFTFIALFTLICIVLFLLKESVVVFENISLVDFIFGKEWRPTSKDLRLGLWPIMASTLVLSTLALLIALPLSIGAALFLSCACPVKLRRPIHSLIDLMDGIPSVIYGFIGIMLLLPLIEKIFNRSSGDSLLAGAILLAVMIFPFTTSTIAESMEASTKKYILYSKAMGVSRWYMLRNLVLPASKTGIIAGAVLGTSRAMGETMAVIMVVGNSPLIPTSLLQRVKPITSLIALEIGSAPLGSIHYHSLFGAGLVLMVILLIVNLVFCYLKKRIEY